MRALVVGGGSWGTAFACVLARRGHVVTLGVRDAEAARAMARDRTNARYLPDVPTLRESGIQGADFVGWFGLFGPARLPEPIAARLNAAINAAYDEPTLKQRLESLAVDPASLDLSALAVLLREEDARWEAAARGGLLPRE